MDSAFQIGAHVRGAMFINQEQKSERCEASSLKEKKSSRGCDRTLKSALMELLKAAQYAKRAQRDTWEFAVEMRRLSILGLTETDFRWLVCMGYVQHAREITQAEDDGRQFRPTGNLSFVRRTCFVLTPDGVSFAQTTIDGAVPVRKQDEAHRVVSNNGKGQHRLVFPNWDNQRHELKVGDKLVKQFKWPAINQEMLLGAFQEEDWPSRIDDPLPPQPEQDSKRRLHDTIKCLNRNQKTCLLHFRGDGTGEGVVWEFVESDIDEK